MSKAQYGFRSRQAPVLTRQAREALLWAASYNQQEEAQASVLPSELPTSQQQAPRLQKRLLLRCQRDIFTPDGSALLMRCGEMLDMELLQRLLRFGVEASDFSLVTDTNQSTPLVSDKHLEQWFKLYRNSLGGETRAIRASLLAVSPPVQEESSAELLEAPSAPPDLSETPAETTKILLWQRQDSDTQRLKTELSGLGYEKESMLSCNSLHDLLMSLEAQTPDVVIIDLLAPAEMNGLALLRLIRKHYPDLRLILTLRWPLSAPAGLKERFYSMLKPYAIEAVFRPCKSNGLKKALEGLLPVTHHLLNALKERYI